MATNNHPFRWVVFVSVLLAYLMMASQRTAPGLITDQLMTDFHVTATTVGLITSIQYFVYTGLQIPMGMLADRYGPNLFLIAGAILTGLGTIFYSISTHVFILFLARMLVGIGDATIWVNVVLILGRWFQRKEFIRLIGFAGMTGSLGFLLATMPFSALILIVGWRTSFLSLGIVLILCGVLLFFVLVRKPNLPMIEFQDVSGEKVWSSVSMALSSRQAWALFFCHFGIVGGYLGFISSWAVPYGMDMWGMTRFAASQLMMVSLIGALIGAPMISWISSRFERIKQVYLIFYCITALCWLVFLLFEGKPPFLTLVFFIIGFAFGANSLTFAIVRNSFSIKESGIISGFANTGGFLSAVLLPGIFGKILDIYQELGKMEAGYHYGFYVLFIFSLFGLVGVCLIKEKQQLKKTLG